MDSYSKTAMERAMKIQEVLLRAMARKITWFQAAEILGFTDRHVRRIRERYEEFDYDGLFDRRRGKPSPKTRSLGDGRNRTRALSREILRSERPPFSREAEERPAGRRHGVSRSPTKNIFFRKLGMANGARISASLLNRMQ